MKFYALLLILIATTIASAQNQNIGLFLNTAEAYNGYVLFSPLRSLNTYLIDNCGKVVNVWECDDRPLYTSYLNEEGNLVRIAGGWFNAPKYLEIRDWNNNQIWKYIPGDSISQIHSDFALMPNGNILVLAEEELLASEWITIGGNPNNIINNAVLEMVVEIEPIYPDSAHIVWQWKQQDHLIQTYDSTQLNYGSIYNNPRKLNTNINNSIATWQGITHFNAIDYNATLNQIMVSCWNCSELFIIDHSTTLQEAATAFGGNYGFGGDFLYRYGNPQNYERGDSSNRVFYGQHNPSWINDTLPFGNNITVFENGNGRPEGNYSRVVILKPPIDSLGNYIFDNANAFLPDTFLFEWNGIVNNDTFFTQFMGGVNMQANGNLTVCEAVDGTFFEINPQGEIVWLYQNPVSDSILLQGTSSLNFNTDCYRAEKYAPTFVGFDSLILQASNIIENVNIVSDSCSIYENPIDTNSYPIDTTENPIDTIDNPIDTTENPIDTAVNISLIEKVAIEIYPNPVKHYLNIKNLNIENFTVKIYNSQFQIVKKNTNTNVIECNNLSTGLYLISIIDTKNKLLFNDKFIKQ